MGAEEPDAREGGLWKGGRAPGCTLRRRSSCLPVPTRRVERPLVATFREASEVPGVGGGGGRRGWERRRRQSAPGPRASDGLLFASSSGSRLSVCPSLFLPFSILERTSSGREGALSHSQHPLVTSPCIVLLVVLTERGAELQEGEETVLQFTRARRLPSPAGGQSPRHPRGHHMPSSGLCRHTELPRNVQDSNTPRVCSRVLTSAALSLQAGVVPAPRIV